MKIRIVAVIALFSLAGSLSAVDQQLLGLIMPDAKAVGGANATQIKASPFGQYLMAQIMATETHYQNFVMESGFDPSRDIIEMLAAAGDPAQHNGLILVRGVFDVSRILEFAKKEGAQPAQYNGATLIASPDNNHTIAFIGSTIALFGDPASVTAALDRRSNPSRLDPALLAKITQLSASQDAWGVTTINPALAHGAPAKGPNGLNLTALTKVTQSSGGVKFGAVVQVSAEAVTETAQDAASLADVIRMLAAFAQLNQSAPNAAQIAAILQSMVVSSNGNTITVQLNIPEDQFEQFSPAQKKRTIRKVEYRK